MSVRTCMHFMTHAGGPLPKIELRPHPSGDTIHMTLLLAEQDFTWSDTAERMRELFTAILAHPLLALPLPAEPSAPQAVAAPPAVLAARDAEWASAIREAANCVAPRPAEPGFRVHSPTDRPRCGCSPLRALLGSPSDKAAAAPPVRDRGAYTHDNGELRSQPPDPAPPAPVSAPQDNENQPSGKGHG